MTASVVGAVGGDEGLGEAFGEVLVAAARYGDAIGCGVAGGFENRVGLDNVGVAGAKATLTLLAMCGLVVMGSVVAGRSLVAWARASGVFQ